FGGAEDYKRRGPAEYFRRARVSDGLFDSWRSSRVRAFGDGGRVPVGRQGAIAADECPAGGVRRAARPAPGATPGLYLFAGAQPGRRGRPVPAAQAGTVGQVRLIRSVAELRGLGLRGGAV